MISGTEKVLALVPVRGGSKGIKQKNSQLLGDHPLMAWPIKIALSVPEIDRIIVSTDDPVLKKIGIEYGAEAVDRKPHLADDNHGVYDVILDLKEFLKGQNAKIKYMVLLEATSPFRSVEMVRKAISLLDNGYDSVASFCPCNTHPDRAWQINGNSISSYIKGARPWVTRQELKPAYELTGEFYAFNLNMVKENNPSLLIGRCAPIIVDSESSIDIDSKRDLLLARMMFDQSPLAKLK